VEIACPHHIKQSTGFAKDIIPNADDQARIRNAFIKAITKVHPRRNFLSPEQRLRCGQFLENFAGVKRGSNRGRVFTTNYDLLLYWVLMQWQSELKMYDGFDTDCVWSAARASDTFVSYLHGAVHHFETPFGSVRPKMEQRKLRWREDASLIEQVRFKVTEGQLPVFVSEGDSTEKRYRIGRNPYLRASMKSFGKACDEASGALFTVGHSLAVVDKHIIDLIGSGHTAVYVGVFSDWDEGRARELARAWANWREQVGQPPLRVRFFRSGDCHIWGPA
jgi:hypothetical protein